MAVKAGEAFVEILTVTTQFQRGLKRASKQLKNFGASATKIGTVFAGLATAFAVPFIGGAKIFADFETSLAKVGTLIEGDKKRLAEFGTQIEKLSIQFGESTRTIADALFDIVSASIPANQAIEVLTASVKLAKAGFTDTKTATSAVITVLKAFEKQAVNAEGAADFLFQTAKFGRTTFEELAKTIGGVATIASLSGVTLDEMGAALATITRSGLSTEESVTSLRATLLGFLKPQKDAIAAAKEYGIELSQAGLQTDGLLNILTKLKAVPTDIITKIFPNIRAVKAILPLIKNLKDFGRDLDEIGKRSGVTEKALGDVLETLTEFAARAKQAGIAILRNLGEALVGPLKKTAASLSNLLTIINQFIIENKDLVISTSKIGRPSMNAGTPPSKRKSLTSFSSTTSPGSALTTKKTSVLAISTPCLTSLDLNASVAVKLMRKLPPLFQKFLICL